MAAMKKLPFNVTLLSPEKSRLSGLLPVQTTDIFVSDNVFHPQGLYSIEIFGELGTKMRQEKHSFIDMRTQVMHPKVYGELIRLKGLYNGIMMGTMYGVWDDKVKDFIKSDIIDGQTGYSFFMEYFENLDFEQNDSPARDLRIQFLDEYRTRCMYQYLVVLPAGLRDIELNDEKRIVEDEINGLYRKVLRSANTISEHTGLKNLPVLNTVRRNLQYGFNEIYDYIESIISGKTGFLLDKWAARNIHGGTRNVITAIDPTAKMLGDKTALTVNDTALGLHQYMKMTIEPSVYCIKNGPMVPVLSNLPNLSYVVDKKTWQHKQITPSTFIMENWGSEKGIGKLLNGYEKLDARHKPIIIDGDYAALVYQDKKYFKVFYDIRELPSHLSRENVHPMTWTEMFYVSVYLHSKKVATHITRYPIERIGSIYPSFVYLRTTVKSLSLIPLDDAWHPDPDKIAACYPIYGEPFYDSMSVHPSRVEGLGADNVLAA